MANKPNGSTFDSSDAAILFGLALVTAGAWPFVGAASLIAPGVVVIWLAIPPRPPFFRDR